MAALLTLQTLARWTQSDEAEVVADPFAADVIDKVSQLICFIGGHDGTKDDPDSILVPPAKIPEWTLELGPDQAPIDVQMIALKVIKRSYENPEQILQAGSIGPLGGDRVADIQALFMDFTDEERATIARYNLDGDPAADAEAGEIYTIPTTRGNDTFMSAAELYATDDQQINLDISADPRPWKIPLFNPGDPGDPNNYDDGV